jgi:hypothetical protein
MASSLVRKFDEASFSYRKVNSVLVASVLLARNSCLSWRTYFSVLRMARTRFTEKRGWFWLDSTSISCLRNWTKACSHSETGGRYSR